MASCVCWDTVDSVAMATKSRRSETGARPVPKIVRQNTGSTDLDPIDRTILAILQKNARTSYKDLSSLVGVAPSTCLERVRALQARGVITGYRAEVDPASVGRKLEALIAVRFRTHDRALVDPFVEYVLSLPETLGLFNVSGEDDYLLHVAVADSDQLHGVVLDRLGVRSEVEHVRTSLVYRHLRKDAIEPLSPREPDAQTVKR
jgi:DNA-binding Lrp family transcriptional regulator